MNGGSCTRINGSAGRSNCCRQAAIRRVISAGYRSAWPALFSPWYQTTPVSDSGPSGAIMPSYSPPGGRLNIDGANCALGKSWRSSTGVQPSAEVPPKLLSIRPIGTSLSLGSFISARPKWAATAEKRSSAGESAEAHVALTA